MFTRAHTRRTTVGSVCGAVIAAALAVPASVALTAVLPAPPAAAETETGGGSVSYWTQLGTVKAERTFSTAGTDTFTLPPGANVSVVYYVSGGGGGGGNVLPGADQAAAGGGGGGGWRNGTATFGPGSRPVVVGAGGAAGANGNESSFNGLVAAGGGAGASVNTTVPATDNAGSGASGGGARCGFANGIASPITSPAQGTVGGTVPACTEATSGSYSGGGGGGASAPGMNIQDNNSGGGSGGSGAIRTVAGVQTVYGAGGGGGAKAGGVRGIGGSTMTGFPTGVGGAGATATLAAADGAQGSGGGGASVAHPTGGHGGDGRVILSYSVYALSYNANGGTGTVPATVPHLIPGELTDVAPNTLTKTGYHFTGWNTAANGTGINYQPGQQTSITANRTLYAQFAANTSSVAFDGNGASGGSMSDQAFVYDAPLTAFTANGYTRTGYTFTGWNTAADGSGTAYTDQAEVRNLTSINGGTVQLHAQWKANDYTVAYGGNGGTGSMGTQSFVYDVAQNLIGNQFTRGGYLFNHWTADDPSATTYGDQASASNLTSTPNLVVTMLAQWSPINYQVAFDGTEADGGSMANQSLRYDQAESLSTNAWTRTGYSFAGWNSLASGTGTQYADEAAVSNLTAVDGDTVTLFAQWVAHQYAVSFEENGGSGSMADQAFVYDASQPLADNGFTRTGYDFAGWNTAADGSGITYTDQQDVANLTAADGGAVVLHAQWAPHAYRVAFEAQGGTGEPMSDQSFVYGIPQNLTPNTFSRTGYRFEQWVADDAAGSTYTDLDNVKNLTATADGLVTMAAQWEPISYQVRFDSNRAGARPMANQVFAYDTARPLSGNRFARAGYDFTGWNTMADGSGAAYADRQEVTNLAAADGAEVVLYAQWAPHHYLVWFGANGGAQLVEGQAFTYGTPQALTANTYTRAGYRFAGWNTEADGSGTAYADQAVVNALTPEDQATVKLYAQWTKVPGPDAGPERLPQTGGPARWMLMLGLLLLAGGAVGIRAGRRRDR